MTQAAAACTIGRKPAPWGLPFSCRRCHVAVDLRPDPGGRERGSGSRLADGRAARRSLAYPRVRRGVRRNPEQGEQAQGGEEQREGEHGGRLAEARLPRKTAPTATPPTAVPAKSRAIVASDEAGDQRTEQPEQREGGEGGHGGSGELAPAPVRDSQTGEAEGRPAAWKHRFWHETQAQARNQQDRKVGLEHQRRGVRQVLGEQPGDLASGPHWMQYAVAPVFAALGRATACLGPAGNGTRAKLVLDNRLTPGRTSAEPGA